MEEITRNSGKVGNLEKINRKDTPYWIKVILQHKTADIQKLAEQISILSHQLSYYDKMAECFQNQVISDINEHFSEYCWNKRIID